MLHASVNIGLLDRYRVPYAVVADGARNGVHSIGRSDGTGPRVFFMRTARNAHGAAYGFEGATLYVELPERAAVLAALETTGHSWREDAPIIDSSGVQKASLYRATDGSIFLPFQPDAPLDALVEERYLPPGGGRPLVRLARGAYYRIKPLLPGSRRLALRRRFRRLQERTAFPAWPTETSLHRLEARLLGFVEEVAGEPLPWIAQWPAPYDWSLVLTHDVEQSNGYAHVGAVRSVEERLDLRSAWYFVPERDYRVEPSLLESLRGSGCEIGLHGLRHDGRDFSPGSFEKRLPAMRDYAQRWGARGFRSPATHRNRTFVQRLGLEHDSSWSDVARYEPQKGGSCSWLPFFIGEVVELPITMPMDHIMFDVLGDTTDEVWRKKAEFLRTHGGMALMLTHPDYLLAPERLRLYEAFLAQFVADARVWHALPHEVADWWRERSLTELQHSNGEWRAAGPGADRVSLRLGAPAVPPPSEAGH
jgi:peptidoglycan/xylan/chitin deacetylase (PgdA/CDA1 family)